MHVTTIDRCRLRPGRFLTWAVDPGDARPRMSDVPPSFNQSMHLAAAGTHSTWLAAAFTVDHRIDRDALGRAYQALITRHGTLRSSFVRDGDRIARTEFVPSDLRVAANPEVVVTGESTLRQTIWGAMEVACHPFGFPAYLFGAIDRDDTSTILCGFDHAHVDAYSISIVIDDLHRLYDGFARGIVTSGDELGMSGNFIDYCAAEAGAPLVPPSDPRLRGWLHFFDNSDGVPPQFPLDLGVAPGERAPQAAGTRRMLSAASTEQFAHLCRDNGSSVFGGMLSMMAESVRRCGGGPELALLFPMHTRHSEPWRNAVGWFTTNAPLRVVSSGDAMSTIRRTGPALRRAVRLGEVPVPQVISAMGGLNRVRDDIFMVSYVDYRRLPGAERHAEIDAQHISNVTAADDAQFWISRTDDGLWIRSRFPDTRQARTAIDEFLGHVDGELRKVLAEAGTRIIGDLAIGSRVSTASTASG
ncbi:condensation domain-containing protein [Gordonia sinesedis]